MKPFRSLISRRGLLWAALALVVLDAGAQDAPAAVVSGTCRDIVFDRTTITSPVQFDLLIRVDDAGDVVSVHSLNDVGNRSLLLAVYTAAKSCKYLPAISNGKPTKGDARLVYPVLPPPQVPTNSLTIESLHDCAPTRADYPAQSRKYNKEGTTRVSFEVDNTGKVTAFGVTKSSGFLRLDFAALVKLATCKFKPATAPDGAPIGGSFKVEYIWRLE